MLVRSVIMNLLISVLSNAGCDVVLAEPMGDEAYLKLDPQSQKSTLYTGENVGGFPADFSLKKLRAEVEKAEENQKLFGSKDGLINCTNAWIEGSGLADILKAPEQRGDREDLL